jgi:hypothetical protein
MLRRVIVNIPGLEVVGEAANVSDLPSMVEQTGAQWVIVSMSHAGQMPEGLESLLVKHPSLCILGIADDGSHAEMEWAEFHHESLEGLSLNQLLGALCTQSSLKLAPPYIANPEYHQHGAIYN